MPKEEIASVHLSDRIVSLIIRLFVWGMLFGIIFLLRSFFLLMFLTFVFAYIQGHAVQRLQPLIKSRGLRVVLVATVLVGLLAAVVAYLVPPVKEQARVMAKNYDVYLQRVDVEIVKLAARSPLLTMILGEQPQMTGKWELRHSPTIVILQGILGLDTEMGGADAVKYAADLLGDLGRNVLALASAFLLSLLFSFLIVLDLPHLTANMRDLSRTKVAFIYREVANSIETFGRELGRAFEAQTLIAFINTILTALGLWILGLGSQTAFISIIVFFFSFIPLVGVLASSVPICLLALEKSGVMLMLLAIAMITIVHLIETYILNPRIYGQHMHMNAVLVLVVLTIGGKLFGLWGLILGIPICTYFFRHAIRYQKRTGLKPAAEPIRT